MKWALLKLSGSYSSYVYELEEKPLEDLLDIILKGFSAYNHNSDTSRISLAFKLGKKYHAGQMRHSGKPFFSHPLIVAILLLKYQPDEDLIIATILHDVVEDTSCTSQEIIEVFGDSVALLIEGLTQITHLNSRAENPKEDKAMRDLETVRKILKFSQKDIRILCIKLVDRLHNTLTLDQYQDPIKQLKKAEETLNIYVPLAKKIGMREYYRVLKYYCFFYVYPQTFSLINEHDSQMKNDQEALFSEFSQTFSHLKLLTNISDISQSFRDLHKNRSHAELLDMRAEDMFFVDIVVGTVDACYRLVSELHGVSSAEISILKAQDFIAHPKLSRYQGIHLSVIYKWQHKLDLRILSEDMFKFRKNPLTIQEISEIYGNVFLKDFTLINSVTESDGVDFIHAIQHHTFSQKKKVFLPEKGEVFVPENFSALDIILYAFPNRGPFIHKIFQDHKEVVFWKNIPNNTILEVEFLENTQADIEWMDYINSPLTRHHLQEILEDYGHDFNVVRGRDFIQEKFDIFHLGSAPHILNRKKVLARFNVQTIQQIYVLIWEGKLSALDVVHISGCTRRTWWAYLRRKVLDVLPIRARTFSGQASMQIWFESRAGIGSQAQETIDKVAKSTDVQVTNFSLNRCRNYRLKGYAHALALEKRSLFYFYLKLQKHTAFHSIYILQSKRFKMKMTTIVSMLTLSVLLLTQALLSLGFQLFSWEVYLYLFMGVIFLTFGYYESSYYLPRLRKNLPFLLSVLLGNTLLISVTAAMLIYNQLQTPLASVFSATLLCILVAAIVLSIYFRYTGSTLDIVTPLSHKKWEEKKKEKIIGYLIRFGAVIIWGAIPLLIKYVPSIHEVDPALRLPFFEVGGLFLVLPLLFFVRRTEFRAPTIKVEKYFFLLVISGALWTYFNHLTLEYTESINLVLISNFAPVIALIFGFLFWRSQISYLQEKKDVFVIFLLFLLGGSGTILLFINDLKLDNQLGVLGNSIAIMVMLTEVVSIVSAIRYVKKYAHVSSLVIQFWTTICIFLMSFLFLFLVKDFNITPTQIFALVCVGALTSMGTILNYEAFKRIDGFLAFLMFNISIFITFTGEAIISKGDIVQPLIIVGGVLILLSSIFAEKINSRAEKEGY